MCLVFEKENKTENMYFSVYICSSCSSSHFHVKTHRLVEQHKELKKEENEPKRRHLQNALTNSPSPLNSNPHLPLPGPLSGSSMARVCLNRTRIDQAQKTLTSTETNK